VPVIPDPVERGDVRKRVLGVLALLGLALFLVACSGGDKPQNTFDPAGPVAQEQKDLFLPVFWVAVAVFVVVEGGIVLIAIKYRHRKGRDRMPPQIHGATRLEIGWTIVPAVVLAFVMVPTVSLIWKLAERSPDAMQVTVQGYQWWWGFEYTDADMQTTYGANGPITTADTLVVPVGRTVDLSIVSAGGLVSGEGADGQPNPDHQVIHSFWAPRLFGKQDAVPGRTNHIVFSADEAGTYWGQCAEFCGLQHAKMKFRIVVLEQPAWEAWVQNERLEAATPTDPLAEKGMNLFLNGVSGGGQCIACHAIGGTNASSPAGPNLTHFAAPEHECFAGCNWDTYNEDGSLNQADLDAWLKDPNAVKLGTKMPNYHLTDEERQALIAYLGSLK
jgi:cytochrome c oxidase subunit 2